MMRTVLFAVPDKNIPDKRLPGKTPESVFFTCLSGTCRQPETSREVYCPARSTSRFFSISER